jgi:hypothetical protein
MRIFLSVWRAAALNKLLDAVDIQLGSTVLNDNALAGSAGLDFLAEAVSFVSLAFIRVSRAFFHGNPIRNPIRKSVPYSGPHYAIRTSPAPATGIDQIK